MTAVAHWNALRTALAEERRRAKTLTRVRDTDFLPAALEVIERPVSPTARHTAYALLGGLALTFAGLALGHTDIVASAPAIVMPTDSVKLVQPAESGVVRSILVHDGQRVAKGQPLVLLDPTITGADVAQTERLLAEAELAAARAGAIVSALGGHGFHFTAPPGTAPADAAAQQALARAQLGQIEAGIAGQAADMRAAGAAVAEARAQAAKLVEGLPLLDQQIAANESLLAKGYVSRLKVLELRRQRIAAVRDRDTALQTINRAGAQSAASASGAARLRAEALATALADQVKAQADARVRREELVKNRQRASFQALRAPVAGVVNGLSVHTVGGVVEAAKPLMSIVPADGGLVVEAKLLNRDAGFVEVGQPVAVKVDAFPFVRYGTVPGRVLSIASDAQADEKLGPVYVARIGLDRATVDRGDRNAAVLSGMTATADIRTGSRTFLSYLLSPIETTRREAAHER